MRVKDDHLFQFKITLEDVSPPVWRQIQVPSTYTFWDLHVAIQDAMGWTDSHLHQFDVREPTTGQPLQIGIPDEDGWSEEPVLPGWEVLIAQCFTLLHRTARYTYDFGDDWRHRIQLEQIAPRVKGQVYPVCTGGRRACPPEDCGGPPGYQALLEALADPKHPEHAETRAWIGGAFDPARFDKASVVFEDPDERWAIAFGEES